MKNYSVKASALLIAFFLSVSNTFPTCSQEAQTIRHPETKEVLKLFPYTYDNAPPLPSPYTSEDGTKIVVALTRDNKYILIPVTVENGEPLDYKKRLWWGKGRQLEVDASDFPTLARTGLHSEQELNQTKTITGRSVAEITDIGRPEEYSEAGFMSHDEDIISVLRGDNRLVTRLKSTHPQMAEPLFHIFNLILTVRKDSERGNINGVLYNQKKISLKFWGHKGWQESIFDDEILGYWEIEMWRELDEEEKSYLQKKYSHLTPEEMARFIKKLSYIHTAEMAPYYIMRYGFYEGHTSYRADPIAISSIFGLRNLQDIDDAFKGELYEILMNHFSKDSQMQIYKHPTLNIQFKASQNWRKVPRPEDKLIHEVTDPDSTVHVVLWYTETEQDAPGYLWKMAHMKDLVLGKKPSKRQIKNREAWVLNVPGYENKKPIQMLLAVIPHGKSLIRPRENALFIIQIWCPVEKSEQLMPIMQNILDSVKITNKADNRLT